MTTDKEEFLYPSGSKCSFEDFIKFIRSNHNLTLGALEKKETDLQNKGKADHPDLEKELKDKLNVLERDLAKKTFKTDYESGIHYGFGEVFLKKDYKSQESMMAEVARIKQEITRIKKDKELILHERIRDSGALDYLVKMRKKFIDNIDFYTILIDELCEAYNTKLETSRNQAKKREELLQVQLADKASEVLELYEKLRSEDKEIKELKARIIELEGGEKQ